MRTGAELRALADSPVPGEGNGEESRLSSGERGR